MAAEDRLQTLRDQDTVTGIDFIYVDVEEQVTLDVYFLRQPETLSDPLIDASTKAHDLALDAVRIYSPDGLPDVPVTALTGAIIDGRYVLRITTAHPGDFTYYRLHIDDARIDRYYNDVLFSFKAGCPSDLDCAQPPHLCPPEADIDFPIDYRARDFWSYRRALLDFAAQRYPDWPDRLEADAGVMLVEVMSALGDELAYYQDRIAREAYLETATQRRSIRRHARLVDYPMHDGLGASTWLEVQVAVGTLDLAAGTDAWAVGDDGRRILYEIGQGLADALAEKTYTVSSACNVFDPHLWDEDDVCLPVGSTELFIQGHHTHDPGDPAGPDDLYVGQWVLLRTDPADPAVPARRWLVCLSEVEDTRDEVFDRDITRLTWEEEQATPFEIDLEALTVRGNMVPATAGETRTSLFLIGVDPESITLPDAETVRPLRAVERVGPNGKTTYLHTLPDPDGLGLVWLGETPADAAPEIHLEEVESDGFHWVSVTPPRGWECRRSLLGVNSAQPQDRHFTLDDGAWERVVGYQRISQEIVHLDYASGLGSTVRFGDGEFGRMPAEGTTFRATYRVGNGPGGNVPADSITHIERSDVSVTNPFAVVSGQDAETAAEVRLLAPDAFRAVTYRAVRPEDYGEALERLDWVQRAQGTARWTGSWLTLFASPDPRGMATLTETQRTAANQQLDRFRQAGREAYVATPRYADLDLEITVCVEPSAYRGEVQEAVWLALAGRPDSSKRSGFFAPDNFTFGTPLRRASLEAAIQAVPGVRAVIGVDIRRRGWFDWRPFSELAYVVAHDEVIRIENDPLHPDRGSLKLKMEGGA